MKLPKEIFIVKRIPPPNEKARYYSVSKTRIYSSKAHVKLFLEANNTSHFIIYSVKTSEWDEMKVEDFK